MTVQRPNSTALMTAAARAAHLVVDRPPLIFDDTLAASLLGAQADELLGYHRVHGEHLVLATARAQATCRSRYTEERVDSAVRSGVRQYVLLGAGLDTFAYRSELADRVHVFEVDHPVLQQEKRDRLAAAEIQVPGNVTYVPLDFEHEELASSLSARGFDPLQPAVVAWLGVSMYLTAEAVANTLGAIGSFAPGTQVVMDYVLPESLRDAPAQQYVDAVTAFAAERSEPWHTFLTPNDLATLLSTCGLELVADVRQHEMLDAAHWERQDALVPLDLFRIAHARTGRRREGLAGG
ncbi:class I SAM-dependent methyltransferase [Streptomyces sulphureus]|uniref:class I SAM-dependent methyltransferase n=1 Tax=Streptomyces sulphureus TaxID=47758 RepID=UPI001FE21A2B|nr:SAM-dependent methyltransferase [Streptomyces sulphureus]